MIANIYWNYPLFDYLYRKTTKLSHNHLFDHSIQLHFIRADDTMWQRHPEYADRCPILFRTIQEATHVCAKLDGNLTYIWEYRRRFRKSTLQRAYHIIYVKPPKKLETYLQDSSTVYTANGKTYYTLEEAEECNKVEDIYKRINGDIGQPVYYPIYKRA